MTFNKNSTLQKYIAKSAVCTIFCSAALAATSALAMPKGYLNGEWQVRALHEKENVTPSHPIVAEIQNQIQAQTLRFYFEAHDEEGTFKLVSNKNGEAPVTCTVTLPYDINYCCVRMQKLFLYTSLDLPVIEEPAGCAETHFNVKREELVKQLEEILHPTFHYFVAGEKLNRVLLEGPYKTPTLELDLERVNGGSRK